MWKSCSCKSDHLTVASKVDDDSLIICQETLNLYVYFLSLSVKLMTQL